MVYILNKSGFNETQEKLTKLIREKLIEKKLDNNEVISGETPLEFMIEDLCSHNNLKIDEIYKKISYIHDSGRGLEVGRYINSWWWTKYGYDDLEAVAYEAVKILKENESFTIKEIEI